jgi:MFS family permease
MPEVPRSGGSTPPTRPHLPPTARLDGIGYRTAAEASPEPELSGGHRVGWGFISLYTLAYLGTVLVLIAPLLVTLALKVNSLVGIDQAPKSLGLVTGIGSLLAMVGNPFFGKMSDRTSSRLGMRRPWMVIGLVGGSLGILIVALAPSILVVLIGWCIAQLFFNALLAALVAVLPDQIPVAQRGLVSGALGVCLPIASVSGTFLVQLFTGNQLAMFLVPCAIGGLLVLLLVITLKDRRLAKADKPIWSLREFASTFYVNPRKSPDFAWAFVSRFLFVLAYAFLTTYQAYYLLDKIGSAEDEVPRQIFLGTLVQSALVVAASLIGGKLSDWAGRRKIFVLTASITYGLACLWSPSPATSAVSSSAWRSADSVSASTWQLTSRSSPTCCRTRTTTPRISVCSISLALFPLPLRRRSHPPSWRSAAAATACCTRSPGAAPSSVPSPSCL